MAEVELEGVTVRRGGRARLDAVNLTVGDGQRVVVLGPSGAGKTMLLRCVAGLEQLDGGQVRIGNRDVTHLPPRERNIALSDQNDSLQPHLDVHDNLAFPLRIRKLPESEVEERVMAEARAFSLLELLPRSARSLSAGERHEVSLARSLVRRASVLLLDEPLARIDASRRATLANELMQIQEGYGVTMIVATNDQRVAMVLGQQLVVVDAGRVVQTGTPTEVHERPATEFVAGFLGSPSMNLVQGEVVRGRTGAEIRTGALTLPSWAPAVSSLVGRRVTVGIRPQALTLADDQVRFATAGRVRHREFLGSNLLVLVDHGPDAGLQLLVPRPGPAVGDEVRIGVDPATVHLFTPGGEALAHGV